MNLLFNSKKSAAKRGSLEAFKSHAANLVGAESVDKITGGALSGCHPVGGRTLSGWDVSKFAHAISTISMISL